MARIIRRYENRKLYDTEASAYVSLADIARMVREGETVQVLDQASGDDLTAQMLTQIILDEGRKGRSSLSPELMHELLRRGAGALGSGVTTIRAGVDDLMTQSMTRVQGFLQKPAAEEVVQLREQLKRLESMLGHLVHDKQAQSNTAPPSPNQTTGEVQNDK